VVATPAITALGRLRQEDRQFETSPGYIARPCHKEIKINGRKGGRTKNRKVDTGSQRLQEECDKRQGPPRHQLHSAHPVTPACPPCLSWKKYSENYPELAFYTQGRVLEADVSCPGAHS
jgi:hypothetical protein